MMPVNSAIDDFADRSAIECDDRCTAIHGFDHDKTGSSNAAAGLRNSDFFEPVDFHNKLGARTMQELADQPERAGQSCTVRAIPWARQFIDGGRYSAARGSRSG